MELSNRKQAAEGRNNGTLTNGRFIYAPFTPEQVKAMNLWQECPFMHPFTCGSGQRRDEYHTDGEGRLVATEAGWICPYCEYRQQWAHSRMGSIEALRSFLDSQPILKAQLAEDYLRRINDAQA